MLHPCVDGRRATRLSKVYGIGLKGKYIATVRVLQKRYDEARELGADGLLLCQAVEDRRGASWSIASLAAAEAAGGHSARAARLWGAAASRRET
jgi:hypothetical protein